MDRETFDVMWKMSAPDSPTRHLFMRIPQTELYTEPLSGPSVLEVMPDVSVGGEAERRRGGEAGVALSQSPRIDIDSMAQFTTTPPDSLLSPIFKTGLQFTTITIDTPNYLGWLYETFTSSGGKYVRAAVQHIQQIVGGAFVPAQPAPPDAVVVCAGLGARTLGGVEDRAVHPIRGQTVLIRAPWVKFGKTASCLDGRWTYVIPRSSGNVSRPL